MTEHIDTPFGETGIDIREYLRVIYEKRWIIISFTVVVCTLSLIRSFMMKPVYEATTKVLIQREAPRVVKIDEVAPMDYTGGEYYRTQHKILQSRSLAEKVYRALGSYESWDAYRGRRRRGKSREPLSGEDGARALLKRVRINPILRTQLVEVQVQDIDPGLAARIANLWAENYVSYILEIKFSATQYASKWLQDELETMKGRLEEAELRLEQYRRANRMTVDSLDDRTKVLDRLIAEKTKLEIELSGSLEYYKPKHPKIRGIRSELLSIAKKIEAEKKKEGGQYSILKRDVDSNREMYESLLLRIRETEVTSGLKTTNIRVVDEATVPKNPVKPNRKKDFLIAFFIGLMGGSGLAFLFEGLDQSIKTPEDVKKYVGLPPLASIALPHEDDDKNVEPEFIASKKPYSTISEAYRSLRTSIMFTAVEHRRKTLLLTSAGPEEGKTTNAINLAIVMAQAGERMLLLDADLRQPRIAKIFNIKAEHGLSEVLAGKEDLDTIIHKTGIQNLDVISCGSIPPNPSELLSLKKVDELIEELGTKYDRIIIDSPPVLAVTDAVVLSGKVDGTIVVVKAGETHRNAVFQVREIMKSVKSSDLIGVILNMVETEKTGGYYHYYHYYGKYGKYGHKREEERKEEKQSV